MRRFDAMEDPTVAAWVNGLEPSGTVGLYVKYKVGVAGLVAVADIAFPELIEVDGLVFIKARYSGFSQKTLDDWRERLGDDRAALSRVVNHFVVWDEIEVEGEGSDDSDNMAAEFIAECWRARAAADFPDRNIVVEVVDQYGPTVVMYEPNA
ncbi:hypothetical protein [Janibacter indicus]|uniref:Uncharacterized protein n=1 Tax=Janibacter indicus TaxID=857417 RepID=A0A1W2CEL5_9MICO|nr:hypothetical protein [Janibacter indicus]SMC83591.1 hypothetical protein SAMN06296429_11127 [Janibacter indicus]